MLYSVVSPLKLRIGYKIISNSMLLRIDSIRFYMLREILSLKLSTVPKSLFLDRWIIERGIWVTRAIVETKPNVWTNHRIQVFRKKSIFCVFGGPKKLFGTPKTLIGLRNHILLKLFDPSYHLWATNGKTGIFWHNQPWKSPKLWLRSKGWPPHKKSEAK